MISITKDNLTPIMDYFHWFHDSYITDIKYEFKKNQIKIYIDIF